MSHSHQLTYRGWRLGVAVWWLHHGAPWVCRVVGHQVEPYDTERIPLLLWCRRCRRHQA